MASRLVVQGVGNKRGVGAALVAAGLVLSGCTTGSEPESTTTTTTAAAAQEPTNPWDLPLEQRPPLFNPCEGASLEAFDRALEEPGPPSEQMLNNEPNWLYSCMRSNDEVRIGVLASWKSKEEYYQDSQLTNQQRDFELAGRNGLRANIRGGDPSYKCIHVFFTSRGATFIDVTLRTTLRVYRGERSADACDVLDDIGPPIVDSFPKGDF